MVEKGSRHENEGTTEMGVSHNRKLVTGKSAVMETAQKLYPHVSGSWTLALALVCGTGPKARGIPSHSS